MERRTEKGGFERKQNRTRKALNFETAAAVAAWSTCGATRTAEGKRDKRYEKKRTQKLAV